VQGLTLGRSAITFTLNGNSATEWVRVTAAGVAKVLVSPSPGVSVGIGRWAQLSAIATDSMGNTVTDRVVTWNSSDTSIVGVSSTGVISAKTNGSASVSASVDGQTAQTNVIASPVVVSAVTVQLNNSSVPASQTTLAVAVARDAAGNVLTGRAVSWSSSDTTIATVAPSGLVTAVSSGTAVIRATVDGTIGSAALTVTVPTVANVGVVLATSSLNVGQTTQATATASDALANEITGLPVVWSSLNTAIATVSPSGLVTAVAGGTVSIVATVSGKTGSATLVVLGGVTISSVSVTVPGTSVSPGGTIQATATVLNSSGSPITTAVTWSSSASTVATVSAAGLITGVASGTATISAAAGGKSGSTTITVQGTTSAPAGGTHISLVVQRFDGLSGSTLVSNTIPLPQGLLSASAVSNVRLYVAGAEQSIYVEPLTALHADGSLRALLVQFNYNLTSAPLQGELVIGQTPGLPRLAKPTASRSAPNAVALPSDANYLVTTELMGPTVTSAMSASWGGSYAKMESDFAQWADYHWQRVGSAWTDDYYDRAAIYYVMWTRTANPEYWRRGTLHALSYRKDYIEMNSYQASAYWLQDEGIALHYLATGDSASWFTVGRLAQQFVGCVHPNPNCYVGSLTTYMDLRDQARVLQSLYLAWRLKSPGDPALGLHDWGSELAAGTDAVLSTQQTDGSYKSQEFCYGFAPYQLGLLNDQLIKQYRYFRNDSRIVTSVQKSVAFLRNNEWIDAANGFHYNSVPCSDNGMGTSVGGLEGAPDLTGMLSLSFAWAAQQSGSAVDANNYRMVFQSAVNTAYLIGSKQFNQAFETSSLSLGLIAP
jgi:uncharacterized protein YjdB